MSGSCRNYCLPFRFAFTLEWIVFPPLIFSHSHPSHHISQTLISFLGLLAEHDFLVTLFSTLGSLPLTYILRFVFLSVFLH